MAKREKRGSRALKVYWNDIRKVRKDANRSYKESREAYKRALSETHFDRKEINRSELVKVITDFIGAFPATKETRLGDTVFMSIDGWMDRAVRLGYELRFELKFYEVKSTFAQDAGEAMEIRSNIRREGDDFFGHDPENGAPSFYWRIRLPIGVYTDGKSYYRFIWPDTGARSIVKSLDQAIEDVQEGETDQDEQEDQEREPSGVIANPLLRKKGKHETARKRHKPKRRKKAKAVPGHRRAKGAKGKGRKR